MKGDKQVMRSVLQRVTSTVPEADPGWYRVQMLSKSSFCSSVHTHINNLSIILQLLKQWHSFYYIYFFIVCVWGGACVCHGTHMEVREKLAGATSLLSLGIPGIELGQVRLDGEHFHLLNHLAGLASISNPDFEQDLGNHVSCWDMIQPSSHAWLTKTQIQAFAPQGSRE